MISYQKEQGTNMEEKTSPNKIFQAFKEFFELRRAMSGISSKSEYYRYAAFQTSHKASVHRQKNKRKRK